MFRSRSLAFSPESASFIFGLATPNTKLLACIYRLLKTLIGDRALPADALCLLRCLLTIFDWKKQLRIFTIAKCSVSPVV